MDIDKAKLLGKIATIIIAIVVEIAGTAIMLDECDADKWWVKLWFFQLAAVLTAAFDAFVIWAWS